MEKVKENGFFAKKLMKWQKNHSKKPMPWRGEKDPYKIWLSEVMLQQTRVEQGLPYYKNFINTFPSIFDLANASEEKILKMWEGLGYYSRARNMHGTAKEIAFNRAGKFPTTYNEILKLKGVGEYTAAAIASFAYGEKTAVVDGNVVRVLSRIFGIEDSFHSSFGKRRIKELAHSLIDKENPGQYNQTIMDFGSTLCKPQKPDCSICPFLNNCFAYQHNLVSQLPVKKAKAKLLSRFMHFVVVRDNKNILLTQRHENDIWKGLYQFILLEGKSLQENVFKKSEIFNSQKLISVYKTDQKLSHRHVFSFFYVMKVKNIKSWLKKISDAELVSIDDIGKKSFPVTVRKFLEEYGLNE